MNTITNTTILPQNRSSKSQTRPTKPTRSSSRVLALGRRGCLAGIVLGVGVSGAARESVAEEHHWGTRSFIRERFFEPGLSPEDAVARIKQTAEGLHSIRDMLENEAWRYVLFYVRLKIAYLSQDLKNAISTLPDSRRGDYARAANDLIENIAELDEYIRTPKVYESYLYYEKTLKSIDEVVAILQA